MFFKIGVHKNFAIFIGKHLRRRQRTVKVEEVKINTYCEIPSLPNVSNLQKQMFFKIDVLKNFAIFTGKYLCWSLFLIKLQTFRSFRPLSYTFLTELR